VLLMQPDEIKIWARDVRAGSNGGFQLNNPNSGSWNRIAWLWEDISSTFACRIRPPVSVVADRVGGL